MLLFPTLYVFYVILYPDMLLFPTLYVFYVILYPDMLVFPTLYVFYVIPINILLPLIWFHLTESRMYSDVHCTVYRIVIQ